MYLLICYNFFEIKINYFLDIEDDIEEDFINRVMVFDNVLFGGDRLIN